MQPKIHFLWILLRYHTLRHFPKGVPFLLTKLEAGPWSGEFLDCGALLRIGEERFGRPGLFYGSLGLFGMGLLLSAMADWICLVQNQPSLSAMVTVFISLYFAVTFDMLRPPAFLGLLKLAFLVISACASFSFTLTYGFLVFFEIVTRNLKES